MAGNGSAGVVRNRVFGSIVNQAEAVQQTYPEAQRMAESDVDIYEASWLSYYHHRCFIEEKEYPFARYLYRHPFKQHHVGAAGGFQARGLSEEENAKALQERAQMYLAE